LDLWGINICLNIKNYFYLYGLTVAAVIAVIVYLWLSNYKNIRNKFFEKFATIPILGYFFRFSKLKWYLYEMSILTSAGITFEKIVKYLLDNTKNDFFKNKWAIVYLHISSGSSLTDSFAASDLLRPEDLDRISAAEVGGGLDDAMMQISDEYADIVELQVKVLNKSLNYAALILIMAFIVFIVVGIYLPMIKGAISLSGT
jgi:type II secretory pathway component PulF